MVWWLQEQKRLGVWKASLVTHQGHQLLFWCVATIQHLRACASEFRLFLRQRTSSRYKIKAMYNLRLDCRLYIAWWMHCKNKIDCIPFAINLNRLHLYYHCYSAAVSPWQILLSIESFYQSHQWYCPANSAGHLAPGSSRLLFLWAIFLPGDG